MHKIYRSTQRLIAAQIISIALAPAQANTDVDAGHVITVDTGEQFAVPSTWAVTNGVQAGGYLGLLGAKEQGQAIFIPAAQFADGFEYLGDVPGSEPKRQAPETMTNAAQGVKTTYTFEEFVNYGRENSTLMEGQTMPWSFTFYGHPVTHENDNCYIIAQPGNPHGLRFQRGDLLHVAASGAITVLTSDAGTELAAGEQA